ncbi:hypothetical protein [Rhizobium sp. R693]|uniref:hypothetical protein n=1 Tax=Rhizobium sp. R693 TaxID=1764276 RepID=UPI000B682C38|nr:hypothetical protein [Rhizobium sp. R693]OWV99192.1 hypothetical protein ATY79_18580 [Rhizobium sp. R693]
MDADLSCLDVNNAYIAGRSTNRLSTELFFVEPDGAMKLLQEAKFEGGWALSKLAGSKEWQEIGDDWTLDGGSYRKFSSCKLSQEGGNPGDKVYDTIWQHDEYIGRGTVWIADGRLKKIRVVRQSDGWMVPHDVLVVVWHYDPARATIPQNCRHGCVDK